MSLSTPTELEPDDDEMKPFMFWDTTELRKIQGFWHHSARDLLRSTDAFRANFRPSRDDVVILASSMKTGTTWLKALAHCILFRDDEEEDMLTKVNPHPCAPTLEMKVYSHDPTLRPADIDQLRLFHTHIPYSYLPDSIKSYERGCKLVYITREPKDTLVSLWHFFNKALISKQDPIFPLERAVESFCSGKVPLGPYWEHVLEYWEESKRSPDSVMFIKYEDLHRNPKPHVRKLASFMGRPFGDDEEEVDRVIWRSSFDRLKDLDVNKTEPTEKRKLAPLLKISDYFRRGTIGDWRNYLTPEMAQRVDDITQVKFRGIGLYLEDEKPV
ncbi:Cytosolic sulfotransferase 17 [Linum grandiflorum]